MFGGAPHSKYHNLTVIQTVCTYIRLLFSEEAPAWDGMALLWVYGCIYSEFIWRNKRKYPKGTCRISYLEMWILHSKK